MADFVSIESHPRFKKIKVGSSLEQLMEEPVKTAYGLGRVGTNILQVYKDGLEEETDYVDFLESLVSPFHYENVDDEIKDLVDGFWAITTGKVS